MTSELLGKTLGGRYQFEDLIGSGTFAEVFRITDTHRRAQLAAKVLRSDIARDATLLERFQREAAVLSRLQHPNIVRYYDIIEADHYRFIVMDYIPGHTLDDELKSSNVPFRPQASLAYLMPLASALHFAHNESIIHRDLKPANILLHDNGTVFVTDFGIARLLNLTSELTLGTTLGTPLYMAPEQITGDPITPATDIYALGVILFRMYTGRHPFRGDSDGTPQSSTATRITYEHVHVPPPPPATINPQLDLAVEEIILCCLDKDPAQRFQSISAMYDALAEAIGAPPIAIEFAKDPPDSQHTDADATPPDVKLPEWSQFMPPVADASAPVVLTGAEASGDDEAQTFARPALESADTIEHPARQPDTHPHLDDAIREASQTIAHQPRPEMGQTIPTLERVVPQHAHPTLRHLAQPPQPAHIAPPAYEIGHGDRPSRRSWTKTAIVIGLLIVLISLCLAIAYLSGVFDGGGQPSDPEFDLTLSVLPGTLPGAASAPSSDPLSRGGTRIAFDSRRAGTLDIYTANADGTGVQQLTGSSGAERGPAWSPDGTQIAFYGASSENGSHDIFVIDADGRNLRNLTNSPGVDDRYPTWSPDGTRIAFHSNAGGDFDIFVINADATGMRALTANDADDLGPDWSPDGTQIAFHTSLWDFPYEIAILDLNTDQVRRVTNNDDTNTFPTWSPDGTAIAYNAISSVDTSTNIYIMSASGENRRQLTNTQDRSVFPDWSPDGSRIIYQRGQPDVSAIYVIDVDGGEPTAITGGSSDFLPEWEPYHD